MQKELVNTVDLLDSKGRPARPGWARKPLWRYNRTDIKAARYRIKEWDYYCILSQNRGISLTVSDMGYMGFIGLTILDFEQKQETSRSIITPFPMGRWKLPQTSASGEVSVTRKRVHLVFSTSSGTRTLRFSWKNFLPAKDLSGEIILVEEKNSDSITVATPFPGTPHAFYYNQKINCLKAEGSFIFGGKKTVFSGGDSFGVLDWGRGVWTYENRWYWGSASGRAGGKPFGFNIGYGFGDLSTHSENALFYNGKLHKLNRIKFDIPESSYLLPWHFSDNEGRFEMDFTPILDRASKTDLLFLKSDQHQVFGRFSGKAVLDDGTALEIHNLIGFAEKVFNRW